MIKRPGRAIKWLTHLAYERKIGIFGLKAVLKYIEYLERRLEERDNERD